MPDENRSNSLAQYQFGTTRQRQIAGFIQSYIVSHGYPPSIREIADNVGLASSSTVKRHLDVMVQLGMIRRDADRPRSLVVMDYPVPPEDRSELGREATQLVDSMIRLGKAESDSLAVACFTRLIAEYERLLAVVGNAV